MNNYRIVILFSLVALLTTRPVFSHPEWGTHNVCLLMDEKLNEIPKPLKIYIMAGQSNMQGSAHKRTIAALEEDPKMAKLLDKVMDRNGKPVICNNAWITYYTEVIGGDTVQQGKVKVGYGFDNDRFGPEFSFGIFMDEVHNEQILIIKTAWGGKSLAIDFRPPSSGPYIPSQEEKQQANLPHLEEVGLYYRKMIRYIYSILDNEESIRKIIPSYNVEQGYELEGFVWFQGWNDMCNPHYVEEYTENLINFIKDIRTEFDKPTLPFVVGILGVYGTEPENRKFDKRLPVSQFRRAQFAAVEQYDSRVSQQYRGHVVAVDSGPFYENELSDIYWKQRLVNNWKQLIDQGKMTAEDFRHQCNRYGFGEGSLTRDEKLKWDREASNAEYHYLGSGKTFLRFGKALAEAMIGIKNN